MTRNSPTKSSWRFARTLELIHIDSVDVDSARCSHHLAFFIYNNECCCGFPSVPFAVPNRCLNGTVAAHFGTEAISTNHGTKTKLKWY